MNIRISGSQCDVVCPCSRWDKERWESIIEVYPTGGQRKAIKNSITVGAVRELYTILGVTEWIDTTYTGKNTLVVEPVAGKCIDGLRNTTIIYPTVYAEMIDGNVHDADSKWQIRISGPSLEIHGQFSHTDLRHNIVTMFHPPYWNQTVS